MDTKDKEMQLFVRRREKGDIDIDFLAIKYIVEDLKQELPEKAELLDKVLDKARAIKKAAIDALNREMTLIAIEN